MGLALEEPQERDRRIEKEGVRLWVQAGVDDYFAGAELDWDEDEGGLVFRNAGYGGC